jgi:bifunctional DNA-binding transcriptional regulator/antitoxin component of YhaV-PrlF toxin-antitoxin module
VRALSYVEGRHRWSIELLLLLLSARGTFVVGGAVVRWATQTAKAKPSRVTQAAPGYNDRAKLYSGLEWDMANVVGPKGQVVIEQSIREALGVQPGARTIQRIVGDHVEIRFFDAPHNRSLKGALAPFVKRRPTDVDETEVAWTSAVTTPSHTGRK